MKNDGLAYVQEVVGNFGELKIFSAIDGNDQGAEGLARVPEGQEDLVVESAEECPGECIFIVPQGMVNLYDLEWELLKRSQVTDRSPKSIMDTPNFYIEDIDSPKKNDS